MSYQFYFNVKKLCSCMLVYERIFFFHKGNIWKITGCNLTFLQESVVALSKTYHIICLNIVYLGSTIYLKQMSWSFVHFHFLVHIFKITFIKISFSFLIFFTPDYTCANMFFFLDKCSTSANSFLLMTYENQATQTKRKILFLQYHICN